MKIKSSSASWNEAKKSYQTTVSSTMGSNKLMMVALILIVTLLQPSHAKLYHHNQNPLSETQLEGLQSIPATFMVNHAGLDLNAEADPYQSGGISPDLLDLIDGYIFDQMQVRAGTSKMAKEDLSIDEDVEDEAANSIVPSIMHTRRADSGLLTTDPPQQTIDLNDISRMLNTFTKNNDNNDLEQQRNGDPDQSENDKIPELIEHQPILTGHQYVQGGAGEGHQLLGPEGKFDNIQVIKTDTALPSYCDPPNPCPIGYTSADGCIEEFVNTASFSREYQASQDCACDSEHSLFDCPSESANGNKQTTTETNNRAGSDSGHSSEHASGTSDAQLTTLARSMQNRLDMVDQADLGEKLNELLNAGNNNVYENPFLVGDKLPTVAKKAPKMFNDRF